MVLGVVGRYVERTLQGQKNKRERVSLCWSGRKRARKGRESSGREEEKVSSSMKQHLDRPFSACSCVDFQRSGRYLAKNAFRPAKRRHGGGIVWERESGEVEVGESETVVGANDCSAVHPSLTSSNNIR